MAHRTNVHIPAHPVVRLEVPGFCRFCGDVAWLADNDGPLHACCELWAAELAAQRPCPSCSEARSAKRKAGGNRRKG